MTIEQALVIFWADRAGRLDTSNSDQIALLDEAVALLADATAKLLQPAPAPIVNQPLGGN